VRLLVLDLLSDQLGGYALIVATIGCDELFDTRC
jgi:hypothetical protein